MSMPELTAESANKTSGNYGILDQMLALKWIKRNIHAFGGAKNPRVTIFGESAGAYNTATLVVSPLAADLFDGAILQSSYHTFTWKTLALSEKTGTACAAKHKCQKEDAKETLECMRSLSAKELWGCQSTPLQITKNAFKAEEMASVDGFVTLLACTVACYSVCACVCGVESHLQDYSVAFNDSRVFDFCAVYDKCITSETGTRNGSVYAHMLSLYKQASPYTCVRPLSAHNLHRSYVLKCNPMEALQVRVCVRGRVYEQVYVDMLTASHVASLALTTGQCRRFD